MTLNIRLTAFLLSIVVLCFPIAFCVESYLIHKNVPADRKYSDKNNEVRPERFRNFEDDVGKRLENQNSVHRRFIEHPLKNVSVVNLTVHSEKIQHAPVSDRNVDLKLKLLDDDELRKGEIIDTDRQAPDVVVKYDSGMFGLIDTDSSLHVWRAPFPTFGEIWPCPAFMQTYRDIYTICSNADKFQLLLTGVTNYVLEEAISRYKDVICTKKKVSFYPPNWHDQETVLETVNYGSKLLQYAYQKSPRLNFANSYSHFATLKGDIDMVKIFVEDSGSSWPSLNMNESYRISVSDKGIYISAKETWGALRALESLSQLIWRTKGGRMFINETRIHDQPRFKHRGVMLDTARHFIPKEIILKNIEAMSMNKFNVFHWHITDDQSFPLVTKRHPEFARYGSFDPETKIYHPEDVKEIIEFARIRGIRVIPEIDTPSHSHSWRKSHPEIMTRCIDLNGKWSGHYGPLNMAASSTYKLLESFFSDIVNLFPDHWIHLGSDEVMTSCIMSNQAIQIWMRARGMFSVDSLIDFYTRKLQNIITGFGATDPTLQRSFIVWQEAYDRSSLLKKGTIVQLWKSQSTSEVSILAKQNIPVIFSGCWYLDRLEYGAQWVNHYQCDPADEYGGQFGMNDYGNAPVNENWRDNIIGGEAAMWMEFFDADNVLPRIWPLASAAAERLWSPTYVNSPDKAAPRLEEMRCRMMLRSIPTGVASGSGVCGQSEERNLGYQEKPITKLSSNVDLSNISSLTLLIQLIINLFHRTFFPVLLFLTVAFVCIYLRLYIYFSTRRMMLIGTSFLSLYMLLWIFSQLYVNI